MAKMKPDWTGLESMVSGSSTFISGVFLGKLNLLCPSFFIYQIKMITSLFH